jgi:hypothetical protein
MGNRQSDLVASNDNSSFIFRELVDEIEIKYNINNLKPHITYKLFINCYGDLRGKLYESYLDLGYIKGDDNGNSNGRIMCQTFLFSEIIGRCIVIYEDCEDGIPYISKSVIGRT